MRHSVSFFRRVESWKGWRQITVAAVFAPFFCHAGSFPAAHAEGGKEAPVFVSADADGALHLAPRTIPLPQSISSEAKEFLKSAYAQFAANLGAHVIPASDKEGWKKRVAEIDLARNRSLQTINSVIQSTLAFSSQLSKRKAEAEARKTEVQGKQGSSAGIDRELESIDAELTRQAELIAQKKRETAVIIAKYDADKQRWRELVAAKSAADARSASGTASAVGVPPKK